MELLTGHPLARSARLYPRYMLSAAYVRGSLDSTQIHRKSRDSPIDYAPQSWPPCEIRLRYFWFYTYKVSSFDKSYCTDLCFISVFSDVKVPFPATDEYVN